jgi:hypothetical protein
MRQKLKIKKLMCVLLILPTMLISQETGLRKSFSDARTGQTYNNFRSDSTEALFYQVFIQGEFLYEAPKSNAEAVYSLDKDIFVEIAEETAGSFLKIKVLDKFHGIIEGWVRAKALRKDKYYGRPFSSFKKLPQNNETDIKKNPHWIKKASATVFSDSTASSPAALLKTGDMIYVKEFLQGVIYPVYYSGNGGILSIGYVQTEDISELAILDGSSSDIEALHGIYGPILLRNDLDKAGFISYKGVMFKNKDVREFTEDKLCREKSADTLFFRYTLSTNTSDIKKKTEIRNRPEKSLISMYRFLPDENIITSSDTVKCRVLELISTPRSSSISVGGIEESSFTNTITKLYITTLEKFGMDIVFQRESEEYTFRYKKDSSSGRIFDTRTDTEKVIKRLVAFRKH